MQRDLVEIVGKTSPLGVAPPYALEPLPKRLGDRLGFGLASELRERSCKLLRLLVSDIQRHGSPRVATDLHVTITEVVFQPFLVRCKLSPLD